MSKKKIVLAICCCWILQVHA